MKLRASSLAFLPLFCLVSLFSSCEQRRRASRYMIPEEYIGWVRIDFNVNGAPELPIEDGHFLFKFPPSGRIQTSSDMEHGWADDEVYYFSGDSKIPLKSTGWGGGGMIWAGFNGGKQGEKEVYQFFFVGPEEKLKESARKEKDGDGHPLVGNIKDPQLPRGQ